MELSTEKDKSDIPLADIGNGKITVEYRSGYYEQQIIKSSTGEKHEKLIRYEKNPAKVVIGKIGNLEISCYPYDFPDKVFYNVSGGKGQLDRYDCAKMQAIQNKIRWYLEGGLEKSLKRKSKSPLAIQIRLAWEYKHKKEIGE